MPEFWAKGKIQLSLNFTDEGIVIYSRWLNFLRREKAYSFLTSLILFHTNRTSALIICANMWVLSIWWGFMISLSICANIAQGGDCGGALAWGPSLVSTYTAAKTFCSFCQQKLSYKVHRLIWNLASKRVNTVGDYYARGKLAFATDGLRRAWWSRLQSNMEI
jgi:hypothetical protein